MPAIHIRDVPTELLSALKRRARRHERSLQSELRQILREVAELEAPGEPLPPLRLHLSTATPIGNWGRDEIYGNDGR
jgi:plasmid stability protein